MIDNTRTGNNANENIQINMSKETMETFFDTAEWNKDQRLTNIKNSITFTNLWLFIIAVALCIIAFCQFYDFIIKYNAVDTVNNVFDSIKPLFYE